MVHMSRKTLLDTARGAPIVLLRLNVHKPEADLQTTGSSKALTIHLQAQVKKGTQLIHD